MKGGSLCLSHEKYIKDGKVLAHLGLKSKVLPGPLTDLSVWVGLSTLIFKKKIVEGGLYKYPIENTLRTAKFLPTWGLSLKYCLGL